MSLHVVSLFSGIGGIDIAFERAGARTVLFCEADKHARTVLTRHWRAIAHLIEEIYQHATTAGLPTDNVVLRVHPKTYGELVRGGLVNSTVVAAGPAADFRGRLMHFGFPVGFSLEVPEGQLRATYVAEWTVDLR